MPTFLVLYRTDPALPDPLRRPDPAAMEAGKRAWKAWADLAGSSLLDFGAPVRSLADPNPEASPVTGFTVLRTDSVAQAQSLLAQHPHRVAGGTIELLEFATPG